MVLASGGTLRRRETTASNAAQLGPASCCRARQRAWGLLGRMDGWMESKEGYLYLLVWAEWGGNLTTMMMPFEFYDIRYLYELIAFETTVSRVNFLIESIPPWQFHDIRYMPCTRKRSLHEWNHIGRSVPASSRTGQELDELAFSEFTWDFEPTRRSFQGPKSHVRDHGADHETSGRRT